MNSTAPFDLVRVLRRSAPRTRSTAARSAPLSSSPTAVSTSKTWKATCPDPSRSSGQRRQRPPATASSTAPQGTLQPSPGAISGQGGHDATFHVACVLVEGFGLSVADALPIMHGWNTTCQPPWDDAQLRHKLESADARAERRGYLLTNDDHQPCGAPMVNRLVLVGA